MGKKAQHVLVGFAVEGDFLSVGPVLRDNFLDTANAQVVGIQGRNPVVVLFIAAFQVAGGGAGGSRDAFTLVHLIVDQQTQFLRSFPLELPETHRVGSGHGVGRKRTFLHGQVLEVDRHFLLDQDTFQNRKIENGAIHFGFPKPLVGHQAADIGLNGPFGPVVELNVNTAKHDVVRHVGNILRPRRKAKRKRTKNREDLAERVNVFVIHGG